jgi:hypothetical protein
VRMGQSIRLVPSPLGPPSSRVPSAGRTESRVPSGCPLRAAAPRGYPGEGEKATVGLSPLPPSGRGAGGEGEVRLYGASGTLIALARLANGLVKPFRVFDGGSELDADGL